MPRLNETRCTIWYHLYNLYKTSMVFFTNIQVFKSLFDNSSFLCLIFQVRNKFFVLLEIISQYLEIVIVRGVFRTLSNMIELFNNIVKSVPIRSFFWSAFSRIRTEYGEIRSISPYSVRMRENTDQKKLRIWTHFTQYRWQLLAPSLMFDRVLNSPLIMIDWLFLTIVSLKICFSWELQ